MKASSAVLLGFVSNACDYLENLIEKGQSEVNINNFNLEEVKQELSERFDSHFDIPKDKIEDFVNAGTKLFNQYINKQKNNKLLDEFAEIFGEASLKEKTFSLLDKFRKEYIDINNESENENHIEDDDLRTIYGNTLAYNNPLSEINGLYGKENDEVKDDPEIDSIFSEILNNEDIAGYIATDDVKDINENEEILFLDRLNDIYIIDDEPKLKPIEDEEIFVINDDNIKEINENDETLFLDRLNDIYIIDDEPKLKPIEDEEIFVINDDDIKEINENEDVLFNDRVKQAGLIGDNTEDAIPLAIEDEELVIPEENLETIHDEYIKELIQQLEIRNTIEEEAKKNAEIAEENTNKIISDIQEMYPYLSAGYIQTIYSLKDELDNEYAEEKDMLVLHRCSFRDLDRLHQFIEIMLEHYYHVNVDEEKMIVDIFKVHHNTKGKIISLIYEISNQVKLLNGEYEGYRVIKDLENWR